ncbi:MAG: PilN domain-containing protein [Desulfococcaceae bacterium]|jgi:type IV pilus assembly protein PilN|nr:PilN domain-containing protein [Desulfococcaceae bacterium]
MIRINLLPYAKAKKRENVIQQVAVFLLLVLIAGIALLWYNAKLNKEIAALSSQIEYTKKEVARYKKIAAEVEELKNKLALLKQKLEVIAQLDANRESAYVLMDTFSEVIIDKKKKRRLWFTKLDAIEKKIKKPSGSKKGKKGKAAEAEVPEVPESNIEIRIDGIAIDNKTVADFMTRLEESPHFTEVRLITLRKERFNQGGGKKAIDLKGFQIACVNPPMKNNMGEEK